MRPAVKAPRRLTRACTCGGAARFERASIGLTTWRNPVYDQHLCGRNRRSLAGDAQIR